jgi:hypothetical protein
MIIQVYLLGWEELYDICGEEAITCANVQYQFRFGTDFSN